MYNLHAEMNILANMIDQEDKSKTFVAVSKRCCCLCELYIDFARKQGYNIRETWEDISRMEPPTNCKYQFQDKYILANLDRVTENKVKHYTRSFDSEKKF